VFLAEDGFPFEKVPGYAILVAATCWGVAQVVKVLRNGKSDPDPKRPSAGELDPAEWEKRIADIFDRRLSRRNLEIAEVFRALINEEHSSHVDEIRRAVREVLKEKKSVISRQSIRCPHCKLMQFKRKSEICVRCKQSYAPRIEPVAPVVAIDRVTRFTPHQLHSFEFWIGVVMCWLRVRRGLGALDLTERAGLSRQYVCKVEMGRAVPSITPHRGKMKWSFDRYCEALNTTPLHVLRMTEFLVTGQ
jgi:predicted Zn-ribbon and HTH transcriptional regulator